MKLTVEDSPEAIKRYGHLKAASGLGAVRCAAHCPGTRHACSREKGHRGPHAAHGRLRKVVAVWDSGAAAASVPAKRPAAKSRPIGTDDEGLVSPVKRIASAIAGVAPSLEAGIFLILFVAMVGFVIEWALRMIGAL